MTSVTVTCPDTHPGERCWLLAPLGWPATRPSARQLHRMLASLADLLGTVAAAHRLATELAARSGPPAPGWPAALGAIDVVAVDATDTVALVCQLIDHDLDEAAGHLREGLDHRLQALQLLRGAVRTDWPVGLDHQHVAELLADVIDHLDQAGRSLAAADHTLITATRKARE